MIKSWFTRIFSSKLIIKAPTTIKGVALQYLVKCYCHVSKCNVAMRLRNGEMFDNRRTATITAAYGSEKNFKDDRLINHGGLVL